MVKPIPWGRLLAVTVVAGPLLGHAGGVARTDSSSFTVLYPTQDTWINSRGARNWGDGDTIYVGTTNLYGSLRGLVQFDLSGLPPDAIIDSVDLLAWYYTCSMSSGCAGMVVTVHRLIREWEEAEANWVNIGNASDARTYASQYVGGFDDAPRWINWDVTPLVTEWHSAEQPNHGLALHGPEVGAENYKVFTTREKDPDKQPRLFIEYHTPSPTPTQSPTQSPTALPSATPTATLTTSDTPTVTSTSSAEPSATATATETATFDPSATPTATNTPCLLYTSPSPRDRS